MEMWAGAVPDDVARRWTLAVEHRERLMNVARSRVVDPADAEDVVSEAMLRAVAYARLDEARIGALLTTLTMRLCVDLHRGRGRELRAGTALVSRELPEVGPEESVCDRAEAEWVWTIASTLPARQWEALALKASGIEIAEAATSMNLSYKAFESALSRARSSVRGQLAAVS
jgi:RNA polymerase sigma factor (sigma-70 family)